MKRIIRVTESQLDKIIVKRITEQTLRTSNLQAPDTMDSNPMQNSSPIQNTTTAPVTPAAKPAAKSQYVQPSMLNTSIKKGDSGPRVTELQTNLQKLGYGTKADGLFGPVTQTAVFNFQRANKLPSDGVVGPQTSNMIKSAIKTNQLTNPLQNPPPAKTFGVNQSDANKPAPVAPQPSNPGYGGGGGWLSKKLTNESMNEAREILLTTFKKLF